MPQSIPKGLNREHVLAAIADLDGGIEHTFGKPTGYRMAMSSILNPAERKRTVCDVTTSRCH